MRNKKVASQPPKKALLTVKLIEGLEPPKKKGERLTIQDDASRGGVHGLRLYASQSFKGFRLVMRWPDPARPGRVALQPASRTLGAYDGGAGNLELSIAPVPCTLEQARWRAREWRRMVQMGIDPAVKLAEMRLENARAASNTFGAVLDAYIKERKGETIGRQPIKPGRTPVPAHKKTTQEEAMLRKHYGTRWNDRAITSIRTPEIRAAIQAVARAHGVHQARNSGGYLRGLWSWVVEEGCFGVETLPMPKLKKKGTGAILKNRKEKRTRVLDEDEMRAYWAATEKMAYPWRELYQLGFLTGQRRGEIAAMSWDELDLEKAEWRIPGERMKMGLEHLVPLAPRALSILKELDALRRKPETKLVEGERYLRRWDHGEFVLSANHGKADIRNFAGQWKNFGALMKEGGYKLKKGQIPFIFHDLRRTIRTRLAAVPSVGDVVAARVISHVDQSTADAKHYNMYDYADEKRRALEIWEQKLAGILNPAADNVVTFAR